MGKSGKGELLLHDFFLDGNGDVQWRRPNLADCGFLFEFKGLVFDKDDDGNWGYIWRQYAIDRFFYCSFKVDEILEACNSGAYQKKEPKKDIIDVKDVVVVGLDFEGVSGFMMDRLVRDFYFRIFDNSDDVMKFVVKWFNNWEAYLDDFRRGGKVELPLRLNSDEKNEVLWPRFERYRNL